MLQAKTHAQIAREALTILDRDGWNKGALCAEQTDLEQSRSWYQNQPQNLRVGSHCIGGAVNIALSGDRSWLESEYGDEFYQHLASKIRELFPDRYKHDSNEDIWSIAMWNNHPATTEQDVRTVLEKI